MYASNDYFPSIHFIVHWTGTFLVNVILSWIYQWYSMTGIYLVCTWYIPRLSLFWSWVSKCIEIKYKTITTTLHQHGNINANAGNTSWTLIKHDLLSCYTWQVDRYQVYVCHIRVWSIARFLAFLVSAARRDVSDLVCLRTPSVFATESPPIRGWGLPKFHSQELISYILSKTLL
jgi:hypothetical protein